MALPAVNTSQAVTGGIGEGLQSFVTAYQNALNYQLQKKQQAALENYQEVMGDAASRNANASNAQAYAELMKRGSIVATPNAAKLGMEPPAFPSASPQTQDQVNLPSQAAPVAPPATPGSTEQGPGFIGPPRPPGLLPQTPAPSQSSGFIQSGLAKPQMNGMFPPGVIPSEEQQAAMQKLIDMREARNEKEGITGEHYEIDPGSQRLVRSNVPLSEQGQLERQGKINTNLNEKTGQRTGNMKVVGDFDGDPNVVAARASAVPMNQVIQFMNNKNPRPEQKQAAFMSALRVLDPNVSSSAKTPEEAMKQSASLNDQVNSILSSIRGSGLSDEILNGTISAAIDSHVSNTKGMMEASQKAVKAAGFRGNENDPNLQVDAPVMRAYQGALQLKKKIGENVLPSQRPNNPGLIDTLKNTWNEITGGTKSSTPSFSPDVINYAQKHGISPEQANTIKIQRGGK